MTLTQAIVENMSIMILRCKYPFRKRNSVDPVVFVDHFIMYGKLGCLNYVSLLKITSKTYPNVPSSLQKEEIFIAVTLKIYANSSVHTPPQYSVAKIKFVHDKLLFRKIKSRK